MPNTNEHQILLGYFATTLLALMLANGVSDAVVAMPFVTSAEGEGSDFGHILTAVLFFGLCFANPVGIFIRKSKWLAAVPWFLAGAIFGYVFQLDVVAPYFGDALARFALLFAAALGVPAMILRQHATGLVQRLHAAPNGFAAKLLFRIAFLPESVWFCLISLSVLGAFALLRVDTPATFSILVLVFVALVVAIISAARETTRPVTPIEELTLEWERYEAAAEAPQQNLFVEAATHMREDVLRHVAPGAAITGALIWLAVTVTPTLIDLGQPLLDRHPISLDTSLITMVIGLLMVIVGLVLSLLAGMLWLRLFSIVARWTKAQKETARQSLAEGLFLRLHLPEPKKEPEIQRFGVAPSAGISPKPRK